VKLKHEYSIGYALLTTGVAIILVSVYLMYTVFTGASAPPGLFELSDLTVSIPLQEHESEVEIHSGEDMSRIMNMGSWYLLMLFIMMAGWRIASLGVHMVREIKVEVKST